LFEPGAEVESLEHSEEAVPTDAGEQELDSVGNMKAQIEAGRPDALVSN
jgi:hypothetical protein